MGKRQCVGGPADGAGVPAGAGALRWIDPRTGKGYAAEAPSRALYVREGEAYVFVRARCSGCGALVKAKDQAAPDSRCPLCGGEVRNLTGGPRPADERGGADPSGG